MHLQGIFQCHCRISFWSKLPNSIIWYRLPLIPLMVYVQFILNFIYLLLKATVKGIEIFGLLATYIVSRTADRYFKPVGRTMPLDNRRSIRINPFAMNKPISNSSEKATPPPWSRRRSLFDNSCPEAHVPQFSRQLLAPALFPG